MEPNPSLTSPDFYVCQALFLPVSKKLKAQKTQKISASKKTQGPFWAKNSVCWSQFEISAKKLWNFDHLKPILTDFMVKNETFKDFLIILAQNSCIWGEMFKILKKTLKILRKNSTIWKKTQCYGVFRTQCDSLKSVKKSLGYRLLINQGRLLRKMGWVQYILFNLIFLCMKSPNIVVFFDHAGWAVSTYPK